jgi:hypothetical protein
MNEIQEFCKILRKRSQEHSAAITRIGNLHGVVMSILRQELDSMIRTIYLLSIKDISERKRLIQQTLSGKKWTLITSKGNNKTITDKEMVELSNKLQGWTLSVYRFGCSFIHLSRYHDYSSINPFNLINNEERNNILKHLRYYHAGPMNNNPSFDKLAHYFPSVFEKISSNLECYIKDLENNKEISIE